MIAGKGGLVRLIEDVGILDYELLPGLRKRYPRDNFHEHQLILSTFLYARDDAYLISDAVRSLVAQGASGLVVKNVFHLEIPETAIRYAEARNFPIMVVVSDDFFFDNVIIDVGSAIRKLSSAAHMQRELDALLAQQADGNSVRERMIGINPSIRREFFACYAPLEEGLESVEFETYERRWNASGLSAYTNVLLSYNDGLLAFVSCDPEQDVDIDRFDIAFRSDVLQREKSAPLGISEVHFELEEGADALVEALQAARLAADGGGTKRFSELGIMRALLPCCTQPSLAALSQRVLEPLRAFDAEHEAQLEVTLRAFFDCERSVAETARALRAHQNTVRYRLDRIASVCGLNCRIPSQADQLMLAVAVDRCRSFCEGTPF
ncbi:MAG: PucR family transcriptional regulator [Eggerthellaceae bacterium]|nr:PucR family transcriptional regulator [Eggerthellaceae bacterium]